MKEAGKPKVSKTPPISSRQWLSASTRAIATQSPSNDSPSGPGPTFCDGKFIPSVDISVTRLAFDYDPGFGFGAETFWLAPGIFGHPEVGAEVICDEDSRAWRARVYSLTPVQIQTIIGTIENQLTEGAIEGADCDLLRKMAEDLALVMNSAGRPDPDREDYWLPDGYLEAHEEVHISHITAAFASLYADLVGKIEGISRSCRDLDHSEAATEMEPEIALEITLFHAALEEFRENERNHIPPGDFLHAHQVFLGPWAAMVDTEAGIKGCI